MGGRRRVSIGRGCAGIYSIDYRNHEFGNLTISRTFSHPQQKSHRLQIEKFVHYSRGNKSYQNSCL